MFRFWQTDLDRKRETDQADKIEAGHRAMRAALTSTTDAADGLLDCLRQECPIPNTDALLLCEADGSITRSNTGAKEMFKADTTHHSIREFLYPDGDPLDKVWTALFNNPPKDKTKMIGIREGISFPVEVLVTRLDRPAGTGKLLVLIQNMATSRHPSDNDDFFRNVSESVQQALDLIKDRMK